MLNSGADKVAINSHATENPNFISEAKIFGSSTITIYIEAKKFLKKKHTNIVVVKEHI